MIEGWAGQCARVDLVPNRNARLERPAEIARARHAGEEQLLRRGRHDDRLELLRVGLVPVCVVGVTVDHQVHVHVPESREHGHAFCGHDPGACRDVDRSHLPDGADALAIDQDDGVMNRPAAESVNQRPADERHDVRRLRRGVHADGANRERGCEADAQQPSRAQSAQII